MDRPADRLRPLRRALLLVVLAVAGPAVLTACGGARAERVTATQTSAARAPVTPRGRMLVVFKRSLGVDPLASYFTLYSSGRGLATVVYGGRDGAKVHPFSLGASRIRRLEDLLVHT